MGCAWTVLLGIVLTILLLPFVLIAAAAEGDLSLGWLAVGIVLTLIGFVLIVGLAVAWLDKKSGRALQNRRPSRMSMTAYVGSRSSATRDT